MAARKKTTEEAAPNRARTHSLLIRLSDLERAQLDAVAAREQMNVSEYVRWIVRREHDRAEQAAPKTTKGKR